MTNFVFLYSGGTMPDNEDDKKKMMDAWGAWYGEMGDAVVDPGNPFGDRVGLSSGGDGAAADVNGYTIVSADSLDAAKALADNAPHIDNGGTLSIYETVKM